MPSLLSPAALPTLAASALGRPRSQWIQWPGLTGPAVVACEAENQKAEDFQRMNGMNGMEFPMSKSGKVDWKLDIIFLQLEA